MGTLRREKIWNEKVKQRIEDAIIDDRKKTTSLQRTRAKNG